MKKIYTVLTSAMNGTVTMGTIVENFSTEELALKAKAIIEEKNKNNKFPVYCRIEESTLFENEEEIPILNNGKGNI